MGMPALIGAGVGGGLNLIRGKNPIQGALLGGAGGALTGGLSNYMNTGSVLGANTLGQKVAADAIANNAAQGAISNGVTTPWGNVINPDYYALANTSVPVFTGGEGVLSNALGNISSSIPSTVKEYATPQNLLGLANLSMDRNPAPLQNIGGSASARSGQAPSFTPFQTGEVLSPWKKRGA